MMSAAWGKEMRSYLIIFCLVLAITSVVTALEAPAVTGITPQGGVNSSSIAITNLAGINFTSGAMVMLTPGTVTPTHKGSLSNAFLMSPRSVFVSGNNAYVVSSVSNTLEIADVTNPAYPFHMGSISNGAGGALLSQPFSVFVSGNYAYVASYGSNALEIVNVLNPSSPVHAGSISNTYLLNPQSVYVSGNYAYVASYGSNMLEIIDVTNPASPVHRYNVPIDTPTCVFVAGNYAYVTSSRGDSLEIVDVTNPAAPVHTGGISNTYLSNPQSVYVSGNYAYVTSYDSNSLVVADIRNPAAPVISGRISHGGGALLSQPFSVYVSGNYAYVASSNSNALEIVDVTNPAAPVHKGYLANGGTTLLSYPLSVYVSGNYAYIASLSSNAMEIADIGTVTATGVNVVSPNQITCILNLVDKPAGQYNVVVTNTDGKFGTLTSGFTISASGAPVAGFSGTPRSGASPLTVSFTDSSINSPTSWNWSFGDGSLSGLQHPTHTFTRGGAYTISLTATNAKGSNTLTREDYIVVDGAQTGVFRAASGYWYMDYNNTGVVDRSFRFGATSDLPAHADWNADGFTDAGVFRPANGNWYLNYFRDPIVDTVFHFGKNGDIPVTGDWDGDGTSDAGVFRPASGTWYLDTTKTGTVYRMFQFGKNGDIPVTGDWDRDGTSDAGVFRPSSGTWYLDTTKTGVVYRMFQFGKNGDIPVTGDWDGDGTSDAGVFRPSSGTWYLDTTKTGVIYRSFQFGKNGDNAVADDWDGDGTSDAGVFRPSNGNWYLNYYKNGTVNKGYHFGTAGDSPQAGKWFTTELVPIAPVAAFTSNVQSGTTPLTVQFTDQSTTNVRLTYEWDFDNDGTTDSTAKNPSNVFTTVGNYTVSLTVTNSAGSDTQVRTNFITVNPVPVVPVANFTATPRTGVAPLLVSFTDTSTGTISSWIWEYQNATPGWTQFSTSNNPSNTFPAGTYDIRLTVSGPVGSSNKTETGYITISPAPLAPVADFTNTTPRQGTSPLTVTFNDLSTGTITSRTWEYRNASVGWTQFATSTNPSYTFPTGIYDIRLNVTGPGGSNIRTETGYITVSAAPVAPVADFTNTTPREGTSPLTVTFNDLSTGTITSRTWEYRNASVGWTQFATSTNPSHNFPTGIYDIRLNVTGPGGSNTRTETGYITVSAAPAAPVADFTNTTPREGTSPLTVTFDDLSTGSITSRTWEYQNATVEWTQFSTLTNPSYTFPMGIYDIRLNVTGPGGFNTKTETGYITVI